MTQNITELKQYKALGFCFLTEEGLQICVKCKITEAVHGIDPYETMLSLYITIYITILSCCSKTTVNHSKTYSYNHKVIK